jgi:hypothetical protein
MACAIFTLRHRQYGLYVPFDIVYRFGLISPIMWPMILSNIVVDKIEYKDGSV